MSEPSRPVLRWHGGKWLLAPWIISHLPPHRIYVEPFGGAASVLIAYGCEDRDILAAAPIDGQFVPLRLPVSMLVSGLAPTWREALEGWFADQSGPVALPDLYRAFASHPKARANQHWRDKLRQVLQRGAFERVAKGLWQRRAAA